MDLHIVGIDRFSVKVPFREIPARNMVRELPWWDIFEIIKVTLHGGVVGYGETFSFYTWKATDDAAVKRAWGKNAAELMWDDSLGAGLQMALFDAVARAAEVPIHALLGRRVRDRAPMAWWDNDLPPQDLAAECKLAVEQGYTRFKTKGRPWWDPYEQMEHVSKVVGKDFRIGIDFNSTLLNARHAERILPDLAKKYPVVGFYESPIPQGDVPGGKRIQQITDVSIAHHYGGPPAMVQLKEDLCDGFVVGGGASRVMHQGRVCGEAKKPLWLQQVGTGITAAFSLHFAAVLEWAKWPAVNCHQLFRHDLLKTKLAVKQGTTAIPEGPGLGVEFDWDAIKSFRIKTPKSRPPGPDRLMRAVFPSGESWYYSNGQQYRKHANEGGLPVYVRGARMELLLDDKTPRWRELHRRALKGPVKANGN